MRRAVTITILSGLAFAVPLAAEPDAVVKAMQDELARSMERLQVANLERPYFIAYRVDDVDTIEAEATLGGVVTAQEYRRRSVTVEVRVGERNLDNTNFLTFLSGSAGVARGCPGIATLPLEDDYVEIRRKIWLATDAAYKAALERLAKKRAALQNKTRVEEVPDFSAEKPATVMGEVETARLDLATAKRLVRELSGLFREMPEISTSRVRLVGRRVLTDYLNSEGSRFRRMTPSVRFTASARAQALDGMWLSDFVRACGRSPSDLPGAKELSERIVAMGQRMKAARKANLTDLYNGPVLFEAQASAELLTQALIPKLLAIPKPVAENEQIEAVLGPRHPSSLVDKLGARVLPRFLGLLDDPTLSRHDGAPLLGGRAVDDDGVPARPTVLVRRGILKSLLATRRPVRGMPASTSSRSGAGPAPSNLVVSVENGLSNERLREELLALAAERELEYGVVVRRLGSPLASEREDLLSMFLIGGPTPAPSVEPVIAAYRIYRDGREELIRNAEVDMTISAFKDIVAASESRLVVSLPFDPPRPAAASLSWCGRDIRPEDTAPVISVVVPSLLFEDVTLKKPSGDIPKPPVVPRPALGARILVP